MHELRLEELVEERQFAGIVQTHSEVFFRLANTLLAAGERDQDWNKRHYFQLISEADALESFLDDFGARYNRTYAYLTELVASLRWFAYAGYSLSHLVGRMGSYGDAMWGSPGDREEAVAAIDAGRAYLRETADSILRAIRAEAGELGIEITPEAFPEKNFLPPSARRKLPHNVGQEEFLQDEQRIAEVCTKFLQAAQMIAETNVCAIEEKEERHGFMGRVLTEELARVYEATVHNLQSTYDTHIQNSVVEHDDPRLLRLRGHTSGALHLLEAVTHMAHFVERHESETRSEEAKRLIAALVDRSEVERFTVNVCFLWAHRLLQGGVPVAEELLPSYTDLQELHVQLAEDVSLHARPAALLVGIVNHWGTPVEMELGGQRCNAGSILEVLVAVGSHPEVREYLFRGDARPLAHIGALFEHDLGERGLDGLPAELGYLRPG